MTTRLRFHECIAVGSLILAACLAVSEIAAAGPSVVTTFHSAGVYWSPVGGSATATAHVRYRKLGSSAWKPGHPLWFDPVAVEYRGSLVELDPATTYEIELSVAGGPQATLQAVTWSEQFPIAETVTLPETSTQTLVITRGGSATTGYVLYTHAPGRRALIDVGKTADYNLEVRASYVIIRGLTLRGARADAIRFPVAASNVVVEQNDISAWGSLASAGVFGSSGQAGIRGKDVDLRKIVVQRNYIHHPSFDTKSWCENPDGSPLADCSLHTAGPVAVLFRNSLHNSVVRYNTVTSDENHYFEDCLGGEGGTGFPGPDGDVYGNDVARCWDNPIEAEFGNKNTRIWGNFIDYSYREIAIAPAGDGPMYIWRNVINSGRKGPFPGSENEYCSFVKFGNSSTGAVYVYHNTLLQPSGAVHGMVGGITNGASGTNGINLVSRNNILHVTSSSERSIDDDGFAANDYDFDLYNARIPSGVEPHGISGTPVYRATNAAGEHYLDPSSPGYDAGLLLPNFNDNFTGDGPDMGAYESGRPALEFGVNAYLGGVIPVPDPPPTPTNLRRTDVR